MDNSKPSLNQSSPNQDQKPNLQTQPPQDLHQKSKAQTSVTKWIPAAILIVSLVGLADAGYLAFEQFRGGTPVCNIIEGCDVVTTSVYSKILGIPVSYLGFLYYLAMSILMVAWFDRKKMIMLKLAALMSIGGFIASLWFTYVQLFILNAICVYCIGSATTSTINFAFGMTIFAKLRNPKIKKS